MARRKARTGVERDYPAPRPPSLKVFYVAYGRNVMSAKMLEVSLSGIGTVLRLEKGCVADDQMTKAGNK